VTLWVCSALNAASPLPTEGDTFIHSCDKVLAECYSAMPDLLNQPFLDQTSLSSWTEVHLSGRKLDERGSCGLSH
jgi:hypothetical protein